MNDTYIDGPMHPDLFDSETPIREKVSMDDIDLKVYRVILTTFVPEEHTVYVVASDEDEAEDAAWEDSSIMLDTDIDMSSAEVEEIELSEKLNRAWSNKYRKEDGTYMSAEELLLQYIEENNVR